MAVIKTKCPKCVGTGTVLKFEDEFAIPHSCPQCNGQGDVGFVEEPKNITFIGVVSDFFMKLFERKKLKIEKIVNDETMTATQKSFRRLAKSMEVGVGGRGTIIDSFKMVHRDFSDYEVQPLEVLGSHGYHIPLNVPKSLEISNVVLKGDVNFDGDDENVPEFGDKLK